MNTKTAVGFYIAALVAANLSVAAFGPWVSPINAFFLIGLDFYLRDHIHEKWVGDGLFLKMLGLITASGLISYALNPATGVIAVASMAAFCASMASDSFVYQRLIDKSSVIKQNGSNTAGAAVDSILFPALAFGSFMPHIVVMQFAAKVVGGFVWSKILEKRNDCAA